MAAFVAAIISDLYLFCEAKTWLRLTVWGVGLASAITYGGCALLRIQRSSYLYKMAISLHGLMHLMAGVVAVFVLLY